MIPADFLWLKAVGDWMWTHHSWFPPHDLLSPYTHAGSVPNLALYTAGLLSLWSRIPGFGTLEAIGWLYAFLAMVAGLVWRIFLGRWAWILWPLYNGFFHARPQVFTGILFLPFLALRERPRSWARSLLLFLMLVLWLPLHGGGALVAMGLLGLYGILHRQWEDVVTAWMVPWFHPWGGWTFLHGLIAFMGRPIRSMIIEWQPPWFFLVEPTNRGLLLIGGITSLVGLGSLPFLRRRTVQIETFVLSLATWSAVRYMIFLGPYWAWKTRPPLAWWLLSLFLLLAPLGYLRSFVELVDRSKFPPPGPTAGIVVGDSPSIDTYLFWHAPSIQAAVYANWDRFSAVHLQLYRNMLAGTHCAYWRARVDHAVVRKGKPEERCFKDWILRKDTPLWRWYERPLNTRKYGDERKGIGH